MAQPRLIWQSKLVLLLVLPFAAADLVLQVHWWTVNLAPVAEWAIGISLLLGLVAAQTRSGTAGGAFVGAVLTAETMFSTATPPYVPWRTALIPIAAVLLLTSAATRLGGGKKRRLGLAESRLGRAAAQVAANLGVAALAMCEISQSWMMNSGWFPVVVRMPAALYAAGLAALAEAAADTVSSEVGQALGGQPRLLTTLARVEPGTDGGLSLAGTLAGVTAATLTALAGTLALGGGWLVFGIACAGGVFGLFFDSLLGATLERRGWLNNDLVNFLSTASAAGFALGALAAVR